MNKFVKIVGLSLGVLALAIASILIFRAGAASADALVYVTSPLAYADISAAIRSTGIVNPVNQVGVGSEVPGTVLAVMVDLSAKVKKGQVLATLDPTMYQAGVDSARENLRLQHAEVDKATIKADKAKSQLDQATGAMKREQPLAKVGFVSQSQLDTELAAFNTANQKYRASQAQVRIAMAQLEVVRGQVQKAVLDLSKTVIQSPLDGTVMQLNVSVGQTVAVSPSAPPSFTLATNLLDVQVDTSVPESDVAGLKTGQTAQVSVAAFPKETFAGLVKQVRVNPTGVSQPVTYNAVVKLIDATGRLLPGMAAEVAINISNKPHVLSVPVEAVLYRPTDVSPVVTIPVSSALGSAATVWKLVEGKPFPVKVVVGISDGKNLEIVSGDISENDPIILSQHKASSVGIR